MNNFKIDFIGIGAAKCGSTWLYKNIVEHPEICDENPKELRFFDLHYDKGVAWYQKQFGHCGGRLKGEFSVQYMSDAETAARIKRHFPDVKLIAILRKPDEMLFSAYCHAIRRADIDYAMPFSEYLKRPGVLQKGRYYHELLPFYRAFPGRCKVVLTDRARRDPQGVLTDIYQFIGVSDLNFCPADLHNKVNETTNYRFMFIENAITNTSRFLNDRGFVRAVERLKRIGVPALLRKVNARKGKLRTMDQNTRDFLRDYYRQANRQLADLIGQDLSSWDE